MPYKLSEDGKAVMVHRGGRWRVLKKHRSKADAKRHLVALKLNVGERHR